MFIVVTLLSETVISRSSMLVTGMQPFSSYKKVTLILLSFTDLQLRMFFSEVSTLDLTDLLMSKVLLLSTHINIFMHYRHFSFFQSSLLVSVLFTSSLTKSNLNRCIERNPVQDRK